MPPASSLLTRTIASTAFICTLASSRTAARRVSNLSSHLSGQPQRRTGGARSMGLTRAKASSAQQYTYNFGEVFVVEPSKPQTASVIWLHGLGDTGRGWHEIGTQVAAQKPEFAGVRWVFPTAPTRPITLNMGMAMPGWYDLEALDDLLAGRDDERGILESVAYVRELLEGEKERGSSKVVIAGFSQGGAVALTAALRWGGDIAGCLAMSTYLPLRAMYPDMLAEGVAGVPFLMCHGEVDMVVAHEYGKQAAEALKGLGVDVDFKSYRGMGHEMVQEELVDLVAFLEGALGP